MDKILKADNLVMRCLDIHTINRVICNTDKGVLCLQIRKGETNYNFVLDAVPVSKEQNKELFDILFSNTATEKPQQVNKEVTEVPKKKGRPKGSRSGLNDIA